MNRLPKSVAAPKPVENSDSYFTALPKPIKAEPKQSALELMFAYYEAA